MLAPWEKKVKEGIFAGKKNPWKYVSCLKIFSIRSHYAGEEGEKLANSPSASSLHPNIFLSPTVNLSSNPMSPSFKISFTSGQQLLPQCNASLPHGLWQPSPNWSPLSPLASICDWTGDWSQGLMHIQPHRCSSTDPHLPMLTHACLASVFQPYSHSIQQSDQVSVPTFWVHLSSWLIF